MAREEEPHRKAVNGQVPEPDPVAVDLVIPVSAGVADREQASHRREQPDAGGADGTANGVDDDIEALARQACGQLSGIDDLVVREFCLPSGAQVAGADRADNSEAPSWRAMPGKPTARPPRAPWTKTRSPLRMRAVCVTARCAVAAFGTTATASAGSRPASFIDVTNAASLTKIEA